jgi:hypothetical protein
VSKGAYKNLVIQGLLRYRAVLDTPHGAPT